MRATLAELPPPSKELLRCQPVPACHLRDDDARCTTFQDDTSLGISREPPPSPRAGYNLNTLQGIRFALTRRLRRIVVFMFKSLLLLLMERHHAHEHTGGEGGSRHPLTIDLTVGDVDLVTSRDFEPPALINRSQRRG